MRLACLTVVTLLFCNVTAIKLGYVPFFGNDNENVEFFDAIAVLIKSSDSLNPICKNHTLLYLKDLKSYRIWASDMFDASTKFSSGLLYGETYDFGNYDECIGIVVPNKYGEFTGRPCLAKFTVEPPKTYKKKEHLSDYRKFYNQSMLDQVFSQLGDPSGIPRNELYFTYCIPSSCSNEDLEIFLGDFLNLNTINQFKIKAEVDKNNLPA
ncbi:unnamed protein product [Brassicogethes aeneus]|uniref:Nose resistant-to-fluoxetine protein N-terminal domain-containing protein n=1 Tax=Brassicogethes aeneus TaxID=1431903 RepID=A0A9P0BFF3_BRAAE|nr:unnamed protein product [Brassicogethes aeneus]